MSAQLRQLDWELDYYLKKARLAKEYLPRKPHTALIITQGLVEWLCKTKNYQPEQKILHEEIVEYCRELLHLKCSSRDQHTLDELQKKFDTTFGLNFETDDETECSCDDCHNHTCSTYGPLDGCRKVRSRD